jgi:hypothetical protein
MPDLTIRIKKKRDGSAVLTCERADGSRTWQNQRGALAGVFPPHDLTHYAVETVLGYQHGFYGLIADGWEITDFAKPWARGPIPAEAREAEFVVSILETERRMGAHWTAADLAEHAGTYAAAGNLAAAPRVLSDAELARIRAVRAELLQQWYALPDGETIELAFQRKPTEARSR